jgi:hypothetical protein
MDSPKHTPISETFSKVEVIAGDACRHSFTTEQQLAVVSETLQPGMLIILPIAMGSPRAWSSHGDNL